MGPREAFHQQRVWRGAVADPIPGFQHARTNLSQRSFFQNIEFWGLWSLWSLFSVLSGCSRRFDSIRISKEIHDEEDSAT
ncbi:uncharacterized protein ACLA_084750 [Aspergillus clavatus NRRL 1]|uniref:Uncharacterized protein n=1 Tax=Aspergillus clavatus (strain ATCC 1007 / CBS 513.65 / DSM 816 / NCTC 3887 / NRRL 1 / QM 1276 / 107) TaxID=344612 RepID=A1CTZ3_ASPCL|nr:uncharacterized protein ACLA_084750 [Aspergillus clavatus NRRL 1]EAW06780.1 hypothetical protein ACLA_084750 [Aspergillus clavatus NRRL 1]